MSARKKMISDKTKTTLEFPAIIEALRGFSQTAPGRMRAMALAPFSDFQSAQKALNETDDAVQRLLQYGDLPLMGINDIRPFVRRAAAGAILDLAEFLRIASFLRAVERVLDAVEGDGHAREALLIHEMAGRLTPLPGFRRRLEQSIRDEEDLYDEASPELASIRRRLRDAQASVRRALDKVLVTHKEALQEGIITMRSGRYVVPVRSDRRAAVRGIVHDSSSTGSTLFIEPMAVVELNNKIRELELLERREIEKILQELSGIVENQADALIDDTEILAELDHRMAKAKLALDQEASRPLLNEQGVILLKKARHPLIARDRVVPIDFELGKTFNTLVITGPNTGGKTVSLKTCGLLTLMAMSGLFIPASDGSSISFFKQIEVDIGDEQSIFQNLSTFSSHMKEIIRITNTAGPGMLVLLDELGAGTDPSEGAALAIAILDHLKSSGCHTVATTHYRELKGYAMNEPGVENACCEFDTKTLQPTYKLLIGVPGVSNAFVISGRLGLSPEIIDRARSLISEEGQRFEELVSAIEESHREAREIEEKIARLEDEAVEANERLAMTREKLEKEHDKVLESAREEAALLLEAAREEIDQLLLRTKGQSVDHRVASEARGRLSQISKKYQMRKKTPDIPEGPLTAETLVLGKKYRSRSLSIDGVVRALPDAKGQVVLEAGSFRVTVPLSDLTLVRASGKKKADKKTSATQASSLRSDIVMRAGAELMLLGKRADEALNLLDQFIDDALLAGLSPVRIVHGKGTGALRKATHESLSRDRRVETFRLGGEGEGGDGVTVVTLKL